MRLKKLIGKFTMTNKQKYREFCKSEDSIPLFSKSWWLDVTCDESNWDIALVEKDNKIVASLPYLKSKKNGATILSQPKLTQCLGVFIKYPKNQKYEKKISYEKEMMINLIDQLPKYDLFSQNMHYDMTNWLPFYWKGFSQTTSYTYVIEDLTDLDLIWLNFNNKTRTDIRKAEKIVKVVDSVDIEKFYEINKMSFERQNIEISYSLDYVKKIDIACKDRDKRKILFAIDDENQIHAAIYIIWDSESAYYIMGGGNPSLRNSGATHLLIWEAIKFSSSIVKKFDFEGSMMEQVEKFVRSFGAVQKPYFHISKVNSKFFKIKQLFKEVLK